MSVAPPLVHVAPFLMMLMYIFMVRTGEEGASKLDKIAGDAD